MAKPDYSISTPENVDLHLELAGLGNRALATLIDTSISWAGIAVIVLLVWGMVTLVGLTPFSQQMKAILTGIFIVLCILSSFLILSAYYIAFEGSWQGQTPGKKIVQIRVIEANGQPVSWASVFIRNLLRWIDMGMVIIGLLVMLVDRNERRLGDIAAGTLVIRERLPDLSTSDITTTLGKESAATLDVGRVTPQEYELLVSFLKRRQSMARSQRPIVAKELEKHFLDKLSEPPNGSNPEAFLERVYLAYQSRAE